MLDRSLDISVFNEELTLKVLRSEDIIGLKLQAMISDEERTNRELEDINLLIDNFKSKLDWGIVEEYFKIFNKKYIFLKLRDKYGYSD